MKRKSKFTNHSFRENDKRMKKFMQDNLEEEKRMFKKNG